MKTILLICFASIVFFGCSNSTKEDPQINIQHLYTKWFNSYEESVNDAEIYRPQGFKEFPASRYRRTYTFESDGKCKWLVLSPHDAHYEMSCLWSYNEHEKLISIKTESGKEVLKLKVVELNKDLLKIQTQETIFDLSNLN